MTLFRGSRFRYVKKGKVVLASGEVETIFASTETTREPPGTGTIRYTIAAGDTFESIAAEVYGDANKDYVLASVNPQIFFPLDLPTGVEIVIPPTTYAELI